MPVSMIYFRWNEERTREKTMVEILNYSFENKLDLAYIRSELPGCRVITVTERRNKKTKVSVSPIDESWKDRAKKAGLEI